MLTCSDGRIASRAAVRRAAAYALAVALLCLPAIWNRFPLMFDDVGGYMERWPTATLGFGRSAAYGLLLWLTRWSSFVPLVLLQALVTTFVVDRALRIFRGGRSPWALPVVMAAIAVTSAAAFSVSTVMPDAWAAPAVVALHLLAWHSGSLTTLERVAMAGIVAMAGAAHMATFGVIAGLSILNAVAWLARHRLGVGPTGIVVATSAAWSGLVLLLAVDVVAAGRFALTPGAEAYLLGRLVEDGMAGKVLAEQCPRSDWQLCAFRNELPAYSEAFLWDASSPLRKIGGTDDPRAEQEIRSIIARSLLTQPIEHIWRASDLTAEQFLDTGADYILEPVTSQHLRWTLSRYAPWLLRGYDGARQQTESIDLGLWSDNIVVPVATASSFALPVLVVLLWRRHRRREAMLAATVFLALIGNAVICGVISSPNERYQARLVWLATLAVILVDWGRSKPPGTARNSASRPLFGSSPDAGPGR